MSVEIVVNFENKRRLSFIQMSKKYQYFNFLILKAHKNYDL